MADQDKLVLLGIWNTTPLRVYSWFSSASLKAFRKLTGYSVRGFGYVKDGLYHEFYYKSDCNKLLKFFVSLKSKGQKRFLKEISKNFDKHSRRLKDFLKHIDRLNAKDLSNQELARIIITWSKIYSEIASQIGFLVLLDVWYPGAGGGREVSQIASNVRDRNGIIQIKMIKIMKRLFEEAALRIGIPEADVEYLFPGEIDSILKGQKLNKNIILHRKRLTVTANINGDYKAYTGREAEKLLKKYLVRPKPVTIQELKGLAAYPGKAKGKIHFVLKDEQFSKFKTGEILGTYQTRNHYLPLMIRASAIITEIGGITSHAAIVSRELKKPCIVGIEDLLSVFKDGDRVEVDAVKGLVRKI